MFAAGGCAIVATDTVVENYRVVNHRQRNPGGNVMTTVAIQIGDNMRRQFSRRDHAVMTIQTQTYHLRMIHCRRRHRFPRRGSRRMTGVTRVAAIDMIDRFAAGNDAVVTLRTDAKDLAMVHRRRGDRLPWSGSRLMTGIALVAAVDVGRQFSASDHAIVALCTQSDNLAMIDRGRCHWLPWHWSGLMAPVAQIAATDVIRRFSGSADTVMAADTAANDLTMIHARRRYRYPRRRAFIVAGIAGVTAIDMNGRLAAGMDTVMAQNTIANKAGVIDVSRFPSGRGMTNVTLACGYDMIQRFTAGGNPVMTAGTNANHLGMINRARRHRRPGHRTRLMTSITVIAGGDVKRGFTGSFHAIMTTNACPHHLGMVNRRRTNRQPRRVRRYMTGFASVTGLRMGRGFTLGNDAIMATGASTNNLGMIHRRRRHRFPSARRRAMAGVTGVAAINMGRQFSGCNQAVVTIKANAQHLGMIHLARQHRLPQGREFFMAQLTLIAAINMVKRLAAGIDRVMTSDTAVDDIGMVHRCRNPRRHAVTIITSLHGRNMQGMFTTRNDTVMTHLASRGDLSMIKRAHG